MPKPLQLVGRTGGFSVNFRDQEIRFARICPDGPMSVESTNCETEFLMASGIGGSLDDAFRGATTNLVRWLEKTYNLNAAEVSSVLATSIVYEIAEVVDPQVHVVAKVPKSVLSGLKRVS